MDKEIKQKFEEQHRKMFQNKLLNDIIRNFDNLDKTVVTVFATEYETVLSKIRKMALELDEIMFDLKEEELQNCVNNAMIVVQIMIKDTKEKVINLETFVEKITKKEIDIFCDSLESNFIEKNIRQEIDQAIKKTNEEYLAILTSLDIDQMLYERIKKYLCETYKVRLVNLLSEQIILKKQIIKNSLFQNYDHFLKLQNH